MVKKTTKTGGKNARGKGASDKAKKAAAETNTAAQQTTLRFPSGDDVRNAVKRLESLKTSAATEAGKVGEATQKYVDEKHFDKKALGIARQLSRLPDEKLAISLPHLMKYIDDLGLGDRAGLQEKLFEDRIPDPKNAKTGNVVPIGTAARDVVEKAGEAAGVQ